MVKIRWRITDNLAEVDFAEFNTEWNGIYGFFDMHVNNQKVGLYLDKELFPEVEGNENILYWLRNLCEMIYQLNDGHECAMQLLSQNLSKVVIKKNDKLDVSHVFYKTREVIWSEKVDIQEFCHEVICATESFISEIQRCNSDLLDSDLIKKLINMKNMII